MKPWAEIVFIVVALVFGLLSGFAIGVQRGTFVCLNHELRRIAEKMEETHTTYSDLRRQLGVE